MSTTVLAVATACSGDGLGEDDDDAVMTMVASAMAMVAAWENLEWKTGLGEGAYPKNECKCERGKKKGAARGGSARETRRKVYKMRSSSDEVQGKRRVAWRKHGNICLGPSERRKKRAARD